MIQTTRDTTPPAAATSILAAELMRLAEGYEAADRRARTAGIYNADREPDEEARLDALGAFFGLEKQLADLLLLFFRLAIKHQREGLCRYLVEALRPELDSVIEKVLRDLLREELGEAIDARVQQSLGRGNRG